MQDFIAIQPRHEPVSIVRAFIVLGLLAGLFTSGIAALG
jgi:hypothetical protein